MAGNEMFTQEFWDQRYGRHEHVWSGRPNPHLVEHASALTPGRALDVGCGEGADAVWLAEHGWTVTAVDISPVGLERAAGHAREAGLTITWRHADLFADGTEPFGAYELVTSQYLHMPPNLRERALGRLAAAVAPGGSLLVVSHHPLDLEIPGLRPNVPELFYTASELAAHLDRSEWEIVLDAAPERTARPHGGDEVTIHDAVLLARQRR
ncbi:MAG: class I SAM-dependent methyltransferase [Solirubrobacteraceae bacterium]